MMRLRYTEILSGAGGLAGRQIRLAVAALAPHRLILTVDPAGWWIKIEDSFGSLSRADEERLRSIARRAMEIAIKAKPRSYRRRAR